MTLLTYLRLEVNESHPPFTVLLASGEVDIASVPALKTLLDDLLEAGRAEVVVDLSRVRFIDSTGLGVLARCNDRLSAEGGELRIVSSSPRLARVLKLIGLDSILTLHNSLGEALGVAQPLRMAKPTIGSA
jgi:anti-sigma B factor antagonist